MKPIIEYEVVEETVHRFNERARSLIKKGYQPHGDLKIFKDSNRQNSLVYVQAFAIKTTKADKGLT